MAGDSRRRRRCWDLPTTSPPAEPPPQAEAVDLQAPGRLGIGIQMAHSEPNH